MLTGELRAELDRCLPEDDTPYALAFSGGGDSLALLKALASDPRLRGVLHVDHGLRARSAEEAEYALSLARSLGREATLLSWSPGEVTSGLQEKARRARYGLMGDWCRANGIDHLLTAHHADDQAETVLMRVERGSGWRGAAGMRAATYGPVWPQLAGITLLRPALDMARDRLRAELGALQPIEDPSNSNPDFARIRARQRLAAQPGLRDDMLQLAERMARGRDEDAARLGEWLETAMLTHEGELSSPVMPSSSMLAAILPAIGGHPGPADLGRLRQIVRSMDAGAPVALGCGVLGVTEGDGVRLMRDPVAMTGRKDGTLAPTAERLVITPQPQVWDGRFIVRGEGGLLNPERRGHHVGYRVLYGRDVVVRNLVAERLQALVTTVSQSTRQGAT